MKPIRYWAAAVAAVAAWPWPAEAERLPGPVPAEVLNVVDGDTLAVRAHIWLGQVVETRVRIAGIDTPELRARCTAEGELATRARDLVRHIVGDGRVQLADVELGKYGGRVVARVVTEDGTDIAAALLDAGLARPYSGGARLGWCDGREAASAE